jgi:hypothetical protein
MRGRWSQRTARLDVGFHEVAAFEKQTCVVGSRASVGVTIAHVQFRGVSTFAEARVSVDCDGEFIFADRNEAKTEFSQKQPQAIPRLFAE